MRHLPNILTWSRLLSAPLLVVVFVAISPSWRDTAAALLFVFAVSTDFWDGFLARRWKLTSHFGAFLDPVADKIIVITALLLLLEDGRAPLLAVLIIICREICILGLREWLAGVGKKRFVAPSLLGKSKTALQMVAIALLLYHEAVFSLPTLQIGEVLLWLSALLTVVSMVFYLRAAWAVAGE